MNGKSEEYRRILNKIMDTVMGEDANLCACVMHDALEIIMTQIIQSGDIETARYIGKQSIARMFYFSNGTLPPQGQGPVGDPPGGKQ